MNEISEKIEEAQAQAAATNDNAVQAPVEPEVQPATEAATQATPESLVDSPAESEPTNVGHVSEGNREPLPEATVAAPSVETTVTTEPEFTGEVRVGANGTIERFPAEEPITASVLAGDMGLIRLHAQALLGELNKFGDTLSFDLNKTKEVVQRLVQLI